jgi:Tfp pilus assembly protein PilE
MTFIEVMTVVTVVGIMASIALPGYQRTMERARWQDAREVLRSIYRGEEVLFARKNAYAAVSSGKTVQWNSISMDNPHLGPFPTAPVRYSVTTDAKATTFLATAKRQGGVLYNTKTMTINQANTLDCAGGWSSGVLPACTPP